ncbi:MAG: ABC transporter permease subunit [Ilumatobacteraceae bacterium]
MRSQLADVEAAEEEFYLDRPLPVRYVLWLTDFVQGDMGPQFSKTGEPPVRSLKERLPRSFALLVMAQISPPSSPSVGVVVGIETNKPVDRVSTVTTFLIIALPNFALGILLKYVFAIELGWFPQTFNAGDPFLERMYQLLPAGAHDRIAEAAAIYQRLLRTDLITTLQEDFILMARAKGVSRRDILMKHALRPSLFSFITVFGINTGALIGGALVVENIFRVPGLGSAIVEAVLVEDFPVVLAIVMIVAFAVRAGEHRHRCRVHPDRPEGAGMSDLPKSPALLAADVILEDAPSESMASRRTLGIGFWIAVGWIVLIVLAALLAPYLGLKDPDENYINRDLGRPPYPPSGEFWFGSDQDARDVFSRTIYGARVSLVVGFAAMGCGMLFGGTLGMLAASCPAGSTG